jgi:hypothetical protein
MVMVLGLSLAAYTAIHVILSLVGLVTGLVVLWGLLGGRRLDGWTGVFLATTVATSVTGFGFPFERLLPSQVVGAVSLGVLAVAVVARYPLALRGAWRGVYVVSAVLALYLNAFVAVVQAFLKVPTLRALAPAQNEPPFVVAQMLVLLGFVVLGGLATLRFRPRSSTPSGAH